MRLFSGDYAAVLAVNLADSTGISLPHFSFDIATSLRDGEILDAVRA